MTDYESLTDTEQKPADIEFSIRVTIESAINNPPYFEDPLTDYFPVEINRTSTEGEWSMQLP